VHENKTGKSGKLYEMEGVMEELDARIKELLELITAAPWTIEEGMSGKNWPICNVGAQDTNVNWWVTTDNVRASETNSHGASIDAEFIAMARNRIGSLYEELEQSQAEVERLCGLIKSILTQHPNLTIDVLAPAPAPEEA
jgi:hypothetical protein